MKADRCVPGRIQDSLGNDYRDKCHYGEVGVERFELFVGRLGAEGGRLAKRKSKFKRPGFKRVRPSSRGLWRREHVDDLVAARLQNFECFGGECRLAD